MSYREQGKCRSPTLEKLAEKTRQTEQAGEAPAQTQLLSEAEITKRLEHACGVYKDRAVWLPIGALLLSMIALAGIAKAASWRWPLTGGDKALLVFLCVAAIASAIGAYVRATAAKRRRDAAVAAELAWPGSIPFPVTGYRDWLVNDVSGW